MIASLTGTYKETLRPENIICLCKPGVNPFQSALSPSSFITVFVVPNRPLYFGVTPSYILFVFCIYNLTLTVSIGRVTDSATHAEKLAMNPFLRKNIVLDSPSLLGAYILKFIILI